MVQVGEVDLGFVLPDNVPQEFHRIENKGMPYGGQIARRQFLRRKICSIKLGDVGLLNLLFDRTIPYLPILDIGDVQE